MDWNVKQLGPLLALTMLGLGATGFADAEKRHSILDRRYYDVDKEARDPCAPIERCCPPDEPPAPCYSIDTCPSCDFCLGPEVVAGNPAVRPFTCNGDIVITLAGFFWKAQQDGLTYAIDTSVPNPPTPTTATVDSSSLNSIIDAKYISPKFKWDLGFKLGLGYNSPCDGWDVGLVWTNFHGKGKRSDREDPSDNHTLIPLWSDFVSRIAEPVLFANKITSHWKLKLDLFDLELGREYWNSKYLTLRPHIGFRFAYIKQTLDILEQGGSWSSAPGFTPLPILPTNDEVKLTNKFKGIGLRGGLDSVWHLCHGFSLFGNTAMSIVYGRFANSEQENARQATTPFNKNIILKSKDSFRSSKVMADLAFGLNWATLFCDCRYRFTVAVAWEHHMFFEQNQLRRVNFVSNTNAAPATTPVGVNVFSQAAGDLSTQGWTLTLVFDF